ncbi:Bifunctional NMN adenylyltransferase/Nudix hydrolase [archaeon HR06]|nr:Bifunctional NMN adenylyltransferase/Nudix hydrolase [archaeon HR06]
MIGVYIGRFQPFHLGHLEAVKYALSQVDFLYIIIGSAEKSHEFQNPFTIGERINMIKMSLEEEGIDCKRYMLLPLADVSSHALWTYHLDLLVKDYDVVFTNDPLTKRLFNERRIKVIEVPLKNREILSGTEIRRRMVKGEEWQSLVPKSVANYLFKIKGDERVKALYK